MSARDATFRPEASGTRVAPLRGAMHLRLVAALIVFIVSVALSGCKPSYPSCTSDKQCHAGEYCVGGKCQLCRSDSDCTDGLSCTDGQCKAGPGYCASQSDCSGGLICLDHRCRACDTDDQCGAGRRCHAHACVDANLCDTTDDCAAGQECREGHCVALGAGHAPCSAPSVYFDFNETTLTTDATTALFNALPCLKVTSAGPLVAAGHADPRGTAEYNLALSDRRARAVREHLGRLGVDGGHVQVLPRGALDAKGQDEPTWAKDRRVDLSWR